MFFILKNAFLGVKKVSKAFFSLVISLLFLFSLSSFSWISSFLLLSIRRKYRCIYRLEKVVNKPVDRLANLIEPYSRKLYDKYTTKFGCPFKLLFIFLELKCTDNLKRVGLYEKPANEAFIKKVRKIANRCHISIEELRDKRIFPYFQDKIQKRVEQFCKRNNLPVPKKQLSFAKPQPQVRYKHRPK